ncbi:hypothetical protein [Paenibacillus graminis]|uniref:Uncharacterized protein n=1 Tax=Paenibacillus graminis TaxID=189425 RepID=A0A089M2Y6_9BACL|nr:hypothetical protein [Paenibacillus graminis]AIQ68126.1 hypothetical protein PGRAT_11220 [Paenibacillus graminis]
MAFENAGLTIRGLSHWQIYLREGSPLCAARRFPALPGSAGTAESKVFVPLNLPGSAGTAESKVFVPLNLPGSAGTAESKVFVPLNLPGSAGTAESKVFVPLIQAIAWCGVDLVRSLIDNKESSHFFWRLE